jgi:hypothetical protein
MEKYLYGTFLKDLNTQQKVLPYSEKVRINSSVVVDFASQDHVKTKPVLSLVQKVVMFLKQ